MFPNTLCGSSEKHMKPQYNILFVAEVTIVKHISFWMHYLHPNDGIDEEQHGDEQTNIRKSLEQRRDTNREE